MEAVISILGMSACDGTDAVPPNARSHTVLLSGEPLHTSCGLSCEPVLLAKLLLATGMQALSHSSNTEKEGAWPVSGPALLSYPCLQLRW